MRNQIKCLRGAALVASTAVFMAGIAGLANAEEPKFTTATYSDWKVECRQIKSVPAADATAGKAASKSKKGRSGSTAATDSADRLCEMVQSYNFRRTGRRLAKLAIGQLPRQDEVKAVVQVPLNVYLPDGVVIKVDGKTEFKGSYIRCTPTSCFADFAFKKDVLPLLEFAKAGTMTFTDLTRRKIVLALSFKGFSSAFKQAVVAQAK